MKRVIEIDEALYKRIANSDMNDACDIIRARDVIVIKAIADSEPLNEVLDKIIAEIEKLSCFSFTMGNGEVVETPLVNKDVVANIVKKYKESEAK